MFCIRNRKQLVSAALSAWLMTSSTAKAEDGVPQIVASGWEGESIVVMDSSIPPPAPTDEIITPERSTQISAVPTWQDVLSLAQENNTVAPIESFSLCPDGTTSCDSQSSALSIEDLESFINIAQSFGAPEQEALGAELQSTNTKDSALLNSVLDGPNASIDSPLSSDKLFAGNAFNTSSTVMPLWNQAIVSDATQSTSWEAVKAAINNQQAINLRAGGDTIPTSCFLCIAADREQSTDPVSCNELKLEGTNEQKEATCTKAKCRWVKDTFSAVKGYTCMSRFQDICEKALVHLGSLNQGTTGTAVIFNPSPNAPEKDRLENRLDAVLKNGLKGLQCSSRNFWLFHSRHGSSDPKNFTSIGDSLLKIAQLSNGVIRITFDTCKELAINATTLKAVQDLIKRIKQYNEVTRPFLKLLYGIEVPEIKFEVVGNQCTAGDLCEARDGTYKCNTVTLTGTPVKFTIDAMYPYDCEELFQGQTGFFERKCLLGDPKVAEYGFCLEAKPDAKPDTPRKIKCLTCSPKTPAGGSYGTATFAADYAGSVCEQKLGIKLPPLTSGNPTGIPWSSITYVALK